MVQLNQMELQSLRHLLGDETLAVAKYKTYAQNCTDPQLKSHFQKMAQEADQSCRQLIQFLS